MTKIIAALLALALPLLASASCTWTKIGDDSAKVTCTTGTEAAPTLVTEGVPLTMLSFVVAADADTAQTLTSGSWKAYLWIESVAGWRRAPGLDVTVEVAGERGVAWPGFQVFGRRGRIAYVPAGVVVSGGGNTLYLQWG